MNKRRKLINYCIPINHRNYGIAIILLYKGTVYHLTDNNELIPKPYDPVVLNDCWTHHFAVKMDCLLFRRLKRVLCYDMYYGLVTWYIENKTYNIHLMTMMDFPTSIMAKYPYNFNIIVIYLCTRKYFLRHDLSMIERAIHFISTISTVLKVPESEVKVDTMWTTVLRWKGIIYSCGEECGELKMIYTSLLCLGSKLPRDILRYMIVPKLKTPPYK